ncbi:MAG: hypothetical protein DWQ44_03385 [Bacteroidetes bacterium]|nr:MAG: hypothetical protein DWQ33_04420 [Bacteroidota bacterium]REJ99962.1 MAG: hypothetical protein DWQ39_13690 [Bacteroidota bacterium]REK35858.1 MAG: hypothetical protein DWQ44_03385 [Bacteroidota bacterium]REK50665.1 MAG: hypothetical protein DWQ48_04980 [Bacteroidota bacterium]
MKKNIPLVLVLLSFFKLHAQNWQWSQNIGSANDDSFYLITKDLNDNIYVLGRVNGSALTFIQNDTINTDGDVNFILFKYDKFGTILWYKNFKEYSGFQNSGGIGEIVYDPYSDAIILSGTTTCCIYFDSTVVCSNNSNGDALVCKISSSGTLLWMKTFTGFGDDYVVAADVDSIGNIYLGGSFSAGAYYDNDTISDGGNLIKLDPDGNMLWSKQVINNFDISIGSAITIASLKLKNNRIYISGWQNTNVFNIDTIAFSNPNISGTIVASFDMQEM